MACFNNFHRALATTFVISGFAHAAEVDVYLIAGQSNAINFGFDSAVGSTDIGFQLHHARTPKVFLPPYTAIDESFSSNLLDANRAVTELATGIVDLLSLQSASQITFTVREEALQDGYQVILEFSTHLDVWLPATTESTQIRLLATTPRPNGDLTLTFELQENPPERLYWRLAIN